MHTYIIITLIMWTLQLDYANMQQAPAYVNAEQGEDSTEPYAEILWTDIYRCTCLVCVWIKLSIYVYSYTYIRLCM